MKATEFELTAQSEAFKHFNENLNEKIKQCLYELHEGNFEAGDINAKISIELIDGTQEVYLQEGNGQGKAKTKYYRTPLIETKVILSLKKRTEAKAGYLSRDFELRFDKNNESFTLAKVPQVQMQLDESEDAQ